MLRWSKGKAGESEAHQEKPVSGVPERPGPEPMETPPNDTAATAPTLAQLLLSQVVVSAEALEAACARQQETGRFLGEILVEDGALEERSLISFLAKHCKVPHLSLLDYLIDQDIVTLVPREICLTHRLLPIDKMGRNLTVAMVNPLDRGALETVQAHCPELRIKPILCTHAHFETVAARMLVDRKKNGATEMSATSLGLSTAPAKQKPKRVAQELPKREAIPEAQPVSEQETGVIAQIFAPGAEEPLKTAEGGEVVLSQVANAMADSMRATYEVLARRISLFQGLRPEQVAHLFTEGVTVECAAQQTVFEKGDSGDKLFAILSGTGEICDGEQRLAVLTRGDMFGEMALLSRAPRSATARALAPTSLLALSRGLIHEAMPREVAVQLLSNIIVTMSERLRRINETWKPPSL